MRAPEPGGKVLLADGDEAARTGLASLLRTRGYEVVEAGDGTELVAAVWLEAPFDLIISDAALPGCAAVELLERLRGEDSPGTGDTPVVLMSTGGDPKVHAEAARLGAAVVDRPMELEALGARAVKLLRHAA